ncbi:MAG: OmpA family protein [Bacteroidales bacterium]
MKKLQAIFFLSYIFLFIALTSCTVAQQLARADKALEQQAYARAAERYRKVLPKLKRVQQPEVFFRVAETYRFIGNNRQAETMYERALQRNNNPQPYMLLGLAKAQQANEKYALAFETYERYLTLVPQDTFVQQLADACLQLRDTVVKATRYIISPVRDFNSNKDDFALSFSDDDYSIVYFTSTRNVAKGRRKNIVTGEKSSDIFFTIQGRNGRWGKIQALEGKVNTKHDEGTCILTRNLRTMYFTRCRNKGKKPGCKIYSSKLNDNDEWTEAEEVILGDTVSNFAHPSLSDDELELYFVSDMPGGYGGFDIWVATSFGEGWGAPTNMGEAINTESNEMYPFIRNNGTLYFSSNGRTGYGGLDIYRANRVAKGWNVENMGLPINSAADDFAIVFEQDDEAGYFSSRRRIPKKTRGGDDIYRFVLPEAKFLLTAAVRDSEENTPLEEASVKLINSAGEIQIYKTLKTGKLSITLRPETDYLAIVTKTGFFNKKLQFSTKGLEDITTFREEFMMLSTSKAIELDNILYDFGKWTLRPESEPSLDQLAETLNDNPSIVIEIASHSDSRGDSLVNVNVSQKRAQSVVDYLVAKGISAGRLQAKGYGAARPRIVKKTIAKQYNFLKEGDILDVNFMRSNIRAGEEEAIVDQLNRRTEFRVISGAP